MLYHVEINTIDYHNDPHGGIHSDEVIGTFDILEEANDAAREHLLDQWDEDWFEFYEEDEDDDGLLTITAICPEEEEMEVTVTAEESSIDLANAHRLYQVISSTVDYHNDPDGDIEDRRIVGTFETLEEANEEAREYLLQSWDLSFFDEYDETVDRDGMVTIQAVCPEGETMDVQVVRARI